MVIFMMMIGFMMLKVMIVLLKKIKKGNKVVRYFDGLL